MKIITLDVPDITYRSIKKLIFTSTRRCGKILFDNFATLVGLIRTDNLHFLWSCKLCAH